MTDRNGQLRGAPSSPEHPSAKLTSEQLAEIRRRHSEGERAAALAVVVMVAIEQYLAKAPVAR